MKRRPPGSACAQAFVSSDSVTATIPIILCADDFAISGGVSEGILSLAEARRLSATSAIVTTDHWRAHAKSVIGLRDRLSVGLHLNLTFGHPLGPMRDLTPEGVFPQVSRLIHIALTDPTSQPKIAAEVELQLDQFQAEAGIPPDFIDSHQHVHILPGIRQIVVRALKRRFPAGALLIRDPSDHPLHIIRRCIGGGRAMTVAALAFGFHHLATQNGFLVNSGFSGFSSFGTVPYSQEFDSFLLCPGERHMIMCHPGFRDNELAGRDSIALRRPEEYAVLATRIDLPAMIWRPDRV